VAETADTDDADVLALLAGTVLTERRVDRDTTCLGLSVP
jgi:hypothetical protein